MGVQYVLLNVGSAFSRQSPYHARGNLAQRVVGPVAVLELNPVRYATTVGDGGVNAPGVIMSGIGQVVEVDTQ